MSKSVYRNFQGLAAFLTLCVLAASYYFEYFKGLSPCPLCIMQRFCVLFLLLFTLMGVRLETISRGCSVAILQALFAIFGMYFAYRQLWLQSAFSPENAACLPDLSVLIANFPWQDVLRTLFLGGSDCSESSWQFLGLTMAGWSAAYFTFMLIFSIINYIILKKTRKPQ